MDFQTRLLQRGLRRVEEHLRPAEDRMEQLRNEAAMYATPHWQDFKEQMEADLVDRIWTLVDLEDASDVRALQREIRRMRSSLLRPDEVGEEMKFLADEIHDERERLAAAAGLSGATDAA